MTRAVVLVALVAACGASPRLDTVLTLEHVARGDTARGLDTHTPTCAADDGAPDAHYTFDAPRSGTYAFRAQGELALVVTVHNGEGAVLGCRAGLGAGLTVSEVIVDLVEGASVEVIVDGYRGDSGDHRVSVSEVVPHAAGGALALGQQVTAETCHGTATTCDGVHGDSWQTEIVEGARYEIVFTPSVTATIDVSSDGHMLEQRMVAAGDEYREARVLDAGELVIVVVGAHPGEPGRYALRIDRSDLARRVEDTAAVAQLYEAAEPLVAGARAVLLTANTENALVPSCGTRDGEAEAVFRLDLETESAVVITTESFAPYTLELRGVPPAPAVIGCVADPEFDEWRRIRRRLPAGRYYVVLDAYEHRGEPLAVALTVQVGPPIER